jgi:hypothetical protein
VKTTEGWAESKPWIKEEQVKEVKEKVGRPHMCVDGGGGAHESTWCACQFHITGLRIAPLCASLYDPLRASNHVPLHALTLGRELPEIAGVQGGQAGREE